MNSPIRRGRFILAWLVAGIAVLPLSAAVTYIGLVAASPMFDFFDNSLHSHIADDLLLALAIFWLANGFCIGFLQKALVKRYLRVELGSWKVFSVLGALLAGIIAYPCLDGSCAPSQLYDFSFAPDLHMHIEFSVTVAIYLTVFSIVQCLALNRIVKWSWRWVAAHLGSLLLAVLVSMYAQNSSDAVYYDAILSLALCVLVITLATGIVMLRMLSSPRRAAQGSHDEWAYQPAPVETPLSAERSVWDDAV